MGEIHDCGRGGRGSERVDAWKQENSDSEHVWRIRGPADPSRPGHWTRLRSIFRGPRAKASAAGPRIRWGASWKDPGFAALSWLALVPALEGVSPSHSVAESVTMIPGGRTRGRGNERASAALVALSPNAEAIPALLESMDGANGTLSGGSETRSKQSCNGRKLRDTRSPSTLGDHSPGSFPRGKGATGWPMN